MLVRSLFEILNETLDEIADHLPPPPQEEKLWTEKVKALRKMSDAILDGWILLEERFDEKIRPFFIDLFGPSLIGEEVEPKESPPVSKEVGGKGAPWIDPEHKDVFQRARGYFELGMYGLSFRLLKKMILQEPEQPLLRLYYAYSAFFSGEIEEARRQFSFLEQTVEDRRIRTICFNALGILSFHEGKPELAEKNFRQALKLTEDFNAARYNLGLCLSSFGRYQEAVETWEEYLSRRGSFDMELALNLSSALLRLGRYEKAIAVWRKGGFKNQKGLYLLLGQFFERSKEYSKAILCYREVLKSQPEDAEALHGLGWNLWLSGREKGEAVALLKKALSLHRDPLNIGFSLAWIYLHEGEWKSAERIAQELFRLYPDSPLPIALSSSIALMKEDWQGAEMEANRLREMEGEKIKALGDYFYGRIRLSQRSLEEAISAFQRSIRKNPFLKESKLLQGLSYYLSGELRKAEEVWQGLRERV